MAKISADEYFLCEGYMEDKVGSGIIYGYKCAVPLCLKILKYKYKWMP